MLPFFYLSEYTPNQKTIVLSEETSRHVVQVLRMHIGEMLQLTDGKGSLLTVTIIDDHKKKCTVEVKESVYTEAKRNKATIAISLLKNASRFEWFLEKATELGISEIIPLLSERTEKQHFRHDRMKNILVSAMLQSQQVWLPELPEPQKLAAVIQSANPEKKFVAHCIEGEKSELKKVVDTNASQIILIGPEGDFSQEEVDLAIGHNFIPVSLGNTRLRTETAGIIAATLLMI
ncbi:RsmE family RNA methyltransferase [Pinibacter aurantiacus]|uniref:Ribosomal RNA small subunit methyltransferase E n=1 Tax=Pinibacter aurantiacus TaxID=2851599 RepID=A0A9E2S4U5_9BACT|nr:RsmE family RNA methyltransferase [Pinibacter aurantiacus]MBV4356663.1 16S rRNA (uracil(1498)-N(3))-methyltransferase [Pinibacter aurantiacus]